MGEFSLQLHCVGFHGLFTLTCTRGKKLLLLFFFLFFSCTTDLLCHFIVSYSLVSVDWFSIGNWLP